MMVNHQMVTLKILILKSTGPYREGDNMVNQFLIFMEALPCNQQEEILIEMKYMKLHPLVHHKELKKLRQLKLYKAINLLCMNLLKDNRIKLRIKVAWNLFRRINKHTGITKKDQYSHIVELLHLLLIMLKMTILLMLV